MFNEKLFFELCEKHGVEIRDGKGKPKIYENGIERDITSNDVYNIVNPYQAYFEYEDDNTNLKIEALDYCSSDDWALAC